MAYSEASDLDTHKTEYDRMLSAIGSVGKDQIFERALDVGGGGAMHSAFLTRIAKKVYCLDAIDQNARYGGQFLKLLTEKFQRNNVPIDANRIEFHAGDAMDLIYKDALFDLVASFNAFEHIPDPSRALQEIIRVLKPGSLAYITLDPIWSCDTGGHFFHYVPVPWEHLIASPDTYRKMMARAGASDEEISDFPFAMNHVALETFRSAFKSCDPNVEIVSYHEWSGLSDESHKTHPNFRRCLGMGFSEEELLTRGIEVVLRKS